MSEHSTFLMGTKPADFCLQKQKSKEENESQMSSIIWKRKEAKKYFQTLSTALKLVEQNIIKLNDDNDLHLSGMMSHLEVSKSKTPKDETAKSFARKVKESSDILNQEWADILNLDGDYLNQLEKTKICVEFKDEDGDVIPNSDLFEDGLNPRYSYENFQMIPVASFILISALNQSLADAKTAAFSPEPSAAKIPRLDVGAANNDDAFIMNESLFILTFFHGDREVGNGNGKVYLKPSEDFYQPFLQEFGQFCNSTPKYFGGTIDKV